MFRPRRPWSVGKRTDGIQVRSCCLYEQLLTCILTVILSADEGLRGRSVLTYLTLVLCISLKKINLFAISHVAMSLYSIVHIQPYLALL